MEYWKRLICNQPIQTEDDLISLSILIKVELQEQWLIHYTSTGSVVSKTKPQTKYFENLSQRKYRFILLVFSLGSSSLTIRLHVEQSFPLTFHASTEDISEIVFTIKKYSVHIAWHDEIPALYTQEKQLYQLKILFIYIK